MKKLLLSAIACVAFAGSSFASNEVVIEDREVKVENQRIYEVSFAEILLEDDAKACVIVTQTFKDIRGNDVTKSRTICSYHHTAQQIEDMIHELYPNGGMPMP